MHLTAALKIEDFYSLFPLHLVVLALLADSRRPLPATPLPPASPRSRPRWSCRQPPRSRWPSADNESITRLGRDGAHVDGSTVSRQRQEVEQTPERQSLRRDKVGPETLRLEEVVEPRIAAQSLVKNWEEHNKWWILYRLSWVLYFSYF